MQRVNHPEELSFSKRLMSFTNVMDRMFASTIVSIQTKQGGFIPPAFTAVGLLWALVTVAGCTGVKPAAEGGASGTLGSGTPWELSALERTADGVTVLGTSGVAYDLPFLGGFNVPRPQLVDIDGDGDLDVFIQEQPDRLMFLERTGDHGPLAFRSDQYQGMEIGEWSRFVDLDADGDLDLLCEEPFSYVRVYRNVGSPTAPVFERAADSLKDAQGRPIFADRQNIPNLVDIDDDGLLDLFLGRVTGTVARYESVGQSEDDLPQFALVTERFEDIEIVAQFGTARHGANTLGFGDVDGDGDLDLLWGDYFESGVLLITNAGSSRSPVFRTTPRPFPLHDPVRSSGYNAPILADWDGDGDKDLLVGVLGGAFNPNLTTVENLLWLDNPGDGRLTQQTGRFLYGIDVGSESIVAQTDIDGDGRVDLVVANKIDVGSNVTGSMQVFWNETPVDGAPTYREGGYLRMPELYHPSPAFADLDGDGIEDMIMGQWRGQLAFFKGTGRGTRNAPEAAFELVSDQYIKLTRGSNAVPALGDVDGDGDLDLFVGESSGEVNYYENVGTPTDPTFELVSDNYGEIDIGRRSMPTLYDIDGDGLLDLLMGTEKGGLFVYRQSRTDAGAVSFEAQSATSELALPPFARPLFVDLDTDGRVDLLTGSAEGGLWYFRHP